jgi:uncharacterized protein YfaS (alpha-2-macroglobulin family)
MVSDWDMTWTQTECGLGTRLWLLPLLVVVSAALVFSEDEPEPAAPKEQPSPDSRSITSFVEVTENMGPAVAKALAFLAKRQGNNGAFGYSYPVAETSLVALAFMASGNLPARGRYADNVARALQYIMKQAQMEGNRSGYITEGGGMGSRSRMHGHGYATLFLAEIYGMCQESGITTVDHEKLHSVLRKAIRLIEKSQTGYGGWGYEPTNNMYDENSVTICQAQALRSCKEAGLTVNKKVIDKAINYIRQCRNPDGSFKYSLHYGSPGGTFALAAGSLATLNYAGLYEVNEFRKSYDFVLRHKPGKADSQEAMGSYFFYAHYYAALAMYYAGDRYWAEWFPAIRDYLTKKQNPDGSWAGDVSLEFSTACGALILQIPYRYLPIFQR